MKRLSLILWWLPFAPVFAGAGETLQAACAGDTADVATIAETLGQGGWQAAAPADDAAFFAIMGPGMVLLQSDRFLTPEKLPQVQPQLEKLAQQLSDGIANGVLPGARMLHPDGAAALILKDPTEGGLELRCYFAGPSEARFTALLDQMQSYKLLTDNTYFVERGRIETSTRNGRATSEIARFKPEARALGLGQSTALGIYVLTRVAKAG